MSWRKNRVTPLGAGSSHLLSGIVIVGGVITGSTIYLLSRRPISSGVNDNFMISMQNRTLNIPTYSAVQSLVSINMLTPCTKPVTLEIVTQPTGLTVVFSPTSNIPSYSSWMTITAAGGMPLGTYQLILRASNAIRSIDYPFVVTVTQGSPPTPETGSIYVEAFYQSLADPLPGTTVSLPTLGLTGSTPYLFTNIPQGDYSMDAVNGTYHTTVSIHVTAGQTTNKNIILGGGGPVRVGWLPRGSPPVGRYKP